MERKKFFIKNNWLMLLIILQPVLDIIAFWTKSPDGTVAGYVRLLVMLLLPLYLLFTIKDRKDRLRLLASLAVVALVCALHIFNTLRHGAVSLAFDVSYTAKAANLPIMALCFMHSIKNDQTRNQAYWGLFFAAAITACGLGLSVLTGTGNVTYGSGLGISGWVIDDNRCANSIILVVLAAFSVFCAVKSDKKLVNILVPALAALVLVSNGTMTCYLSAFAILLGFVVFLPLEKLVRGCRVNRLAVCVLAAVSIICAAAYPLTPKYKVSRTTEDFAELTQNDFDEGLSALASGEKPGRETILSDPALYQAYFDYYEKCIWIINPDMFARFTGEEIMDAFDFTTDAATLINTRNIKSAYVRLMWNHSDTATKLFGLDISSIWLNGGVDLENDWPAIFYYYGYVGFAAYAVFILYFVFLIIRRLIKDFKTAFTADNFILLLTFALLLGLAQYSGAVLRRPNVSIYLALVLGLIYYQTDPNAKRGTWRGDWI